MNGQGESPDCDFVIRAHKLCLDLNDIIMLINSGHDTEEILHKVVEESSKVLGCESARIALREDENWVIRYVRNLPDDIIGRSFTDEDLPHAALAMISRKPVAIDDAFHDDRTNTEMMKSLGMKSILVLPLLKKDVVIGTLFYGYSSRTVSFTDVEIDYAERIATGVALALQDASLHKNFIEFKRLSDDAREYAENIVETVREPLVVLNSDLKILTANHSFYDTFKVTPEETIGNFIYDLGNRQWDIPGLRVLIEEILPQDTVFNGYEVEHDFVDIGHKVILLNARQIFRENIGSHIILLAMEDITERKQLEAEIQDAREYAENIVETVREPLVVLNSDLKVLTANHSFYDTFKVSPENTIGNFIYDLGNRQWDIPGLRVLIEEILPQDTVFNGYEVEHDFVDIGHKIILLNARQIFRENIGSHIILLAMEDITERKQLEAEIQDAREYAENIVETVREPLVVLNSDLKVLTANHSFYDTFKVSPENTIGNFIYDLGNRQWDIPKLRVLIEEILPQDTVFNGYEVEHNFADIGHKVILLNARQIFRENIGSHIILLAMEDITERKQLEEALRKSADEMEESKNLGDALNEIDTLLYSSLITTQDYNATIQRMLEMTTQAIGAETAVYFSREGDRWRVRHVYKLSGSLVGRSFSSSEVLHTAITAETKRSIVVSDALHSQDVDQEFVRMLGIRSLLDFPLIIKGEVLGDLAFHYHSSAVPFNERQVEFVRKLQNSITLALENARLLDTIQEVNRELETFNYTVAHDLRKPLAVINGYCQMIMTYSSDMLDEKSKGYLQKAYDGTWRMTGLIDALLNFSRVIRGELNRESVNLSAMAKEVVEELQLVEPERRTTIRITEGIKANGDASLLQIVLENIIGNAWKYTSEQEEAIIEFGVTTVGEETAYFVRDNGPGFDMADAEKLFLPFQRLEEKPEFAGHGIGLATVERIIKRHGGRVWSEGALGKGATFYFTV